MIRFPASLFAIRNTLAIAAFATVALPAQGWQDLGSGKGGAGAAPTLTAAGGELSRQVSFALVAGATSRGAWLAIGVARLDLPFFGGTLVPNPVVIAPIPLVSGRGRLALPLPSMPGLAGLSIYAQCLVQEAGTTVALSNAVGGRLFSRATPVRQLPARNPLVAEVEVLGIRPGLTFSHEPAIDNRIPLAQLNRVNGGTGVLVHSGQAFLEEADLRLPGRDSVLGVSIMRRHTSDTAMVNARSIFGPAWAFNYDYTLRRTASGNILVTRFGRVDEYVKVTRTSWVGTKGCYGRLSFGLPNLYRLRLPQGTTLVFLGEGDVGRLAAVESPTSGQVRLQYESTGRLLDRRLLRIIDSYGMAISFAYQDSRFPRQVTQVSDYAGREVRYAYDANGDLVSVRSPVVRSTRGLNDFPNGMTKRYRYSATVPHALSAAVLPNEVAASSTAAAMAWEYHSAGRFLGWVSRFTLGNTGMGRRSAGGTYNYAYELPQLYKRTITSNDAVVRIAVTDRRGTKSVVRCNQLGQMLSHQIFTNLRVRPRAPASHTCRFEYNEDGELTRHVMPNGNAREFRYPARNTLRLGQGNVLREVRNPGAMASSQRRISTEQVFEPATNHAFRVIHPRGLQAGANRVSYTTTYVLDYMERLTNAKSYFAPRLGLAPAALQSLFDAAGIKDLGDVNGDGQRDQRNGNLIVVSHPTLTMPKQASRVGVARVQRAQLRQQFNFFGQLVARIDAEENVTRLDYFGADQINGDGRVRIPGGSRSMGGYLRRIIADAAAGAGRQGGQNPRPVRRTTTFEYAAQNSGRFPGNLLSKPTATVDARGVRHIRLVNELGQLVQEIRSWRAPSGLAALGYVRTLIRNHNGDLLEVRTTEHDPRNRGRGQLVHRHEYDVLGQWIRQTFDAGGLKLVTDYGYDASGNRVRRVRAAGRADQITDAWQFDERDLRSSATRGVGTGVVSTTQEHVDGNGNVVRRVDATGDAMQYAIDGFDRVREFTDRRGNRSSYGYDASGNRVTVAKYGPVGLGNTARVLLSSTRHHLDARDRAFRTDRMIFHYAGRATGRIDGGALDPRDATVSVVRIFDRTGRVVGRIDADNDATSFRYDGLGSMVARYDADGTVHRFAYDATGNRTVATRNESSTLLPGAESFGWAWVYDSLGRAVSYREPNGQTTRYLVDEDGLVVRRTDALGHVVEQDFDSRGLLIAKRTRLRSGTITVSQTFDGLGKLIEKRDGLGQRFRFVRDALERVVTTTHPDGTNVRRRYNGDDELVEMTDQNGSRHSIRYDPNGQPTALAVRRAVGVRGTTARTIEYDGLGRPVRMRENNDPTKTDDDVELVFWYDSLGRVIRETQGVGAKGLRSVSMEWQGSHRRVSTTYPEGRRVVRQHDPSNRVVRMSEGTSVLFQRSFAGDRDIRTVLGNGTVMDRRSGTGYSYSGRGAGYDANGRPVRDSWSRSRGGAVVDYRHTYDGPGGVGTSHLIREVRVHLGSETDSFGLDKAFRQVSLSRRRGSTTAVSARSLDANGNMRSFDDAGVRRYPVVGPRNRYTSYGRMARRHDRSGNLIDDGSLVYRYDGLSRLVEVARKPNGSRVQKIVYDALGRRVLSDTYGNVKRLIYGGGQLLEERSGAGAVLRQYLYSDGRRGTAPLQVLVHGSRGKRPYYFLSTSRGDVGAIVDQAQGVVEYYVYSMLGRQTVLAPDKKTRLEGSMVGNQFGFRGMLYDIVTGLYSTVGGGRDYDPDSGRYLQPDDDADPENPYDLTDSAGVSIATDGDTGDPDPACERSGWDLFVRWVKELPAATLGALGVPVDPKTMSDAVDTAKDVTPDLVEKKKQLDDYNRAMGKEVDNEHKTTGIPAVDWMFSWIDTAYGKKPDPKDDKKAKEKKDYEDNRHSQYCDAHGECTTFCGPDYEDASPEEIKEVVGG